MKWLLVTGNFCNGQKAWSRSQTTSFVVGHTRQACKESCWFLPGILSDPLGVWRSPEGNGLIFPQSSIRQKHCEQEFLPEAFGLRCCFQQSWEAMRKKNLKKSLGRWREGGRMVDSKSKGKRLEAGRWPWSCSSEAVVHLGCPLETPGEPSKSWCPGYSRPSKPEFLSVGPRHQ